MDAGADLDLKQLGEHLSMTERRAEAAERDTVRRFAAAYLADRQGEEVTGVVAALTRHGMFVRLTGLGTDGFIPRRYLPAGWRPSVDRGQRSRHTKSQAPAPGSEIRVRLKEVDPSTGSIILDLD